MDRKDSEISEQQRRAKADEEAAITARRAAKRELISLLLFRGVLFGALLLTLLCLIVIAYFLPADSFLQALTVKVAAGMGLFLMIPSLLVFLDKHEKKLVLPLLAVAVASAGLASLAAGVTRELLLELAIGLGLAVALDHFLDHAFHELKKAAQDALTELKRHEAKLIAARQLIEAAEAEFDYKYAWEDYLGLPRPDKFPGIRSDDE